MTARMVMPPMTVNPDLKDRLCRAIDAPGRPSSDYDLNPDTVLSEGRKLRHAGVLIAISDAPQPHVWLTKRSPRLKHHPGQVAFPGGKLEPQVDRDVTDAALREAEEEIGLPRARVDLLGTLPPHETVTGFTVTPVIGLVAGAFAPRPELGEVAEVFTVPLAHLLDPDSYRIERRRWRGDWRAYYTVPWGPYYVWGATARMLRALADRMGA